MLCDLMPSDDMYPTSRLIHILFHLLYLFYLFSHCSIPTDYFSLEHFEHQTAHTGFSAYETAFSFMQRDGHCRCAHTASLNNKTTCMKQALQFEEIIDRNTCHSATQPILCHTVFFATSEPVSCVHSM